MVGKFYHLMNQQEDYFKNIGYNGCKYTTFLKNNLVVQENVVYLLL
jgi:hypothetical protein